MAVNAKMQLNSIAHIHICTSVVMNVFIIETVTKKQAVTSIDNGMLNS